MGYMVSPRWGTWFVQDGVHGYARGVTWLAQAGLPG